MTGHAITQPDGDKIAADAWAIFAIALAARLAYVVYARAADPYFAWAGTGLDPSIYQNWAKEILDGDVALRAKGLFYFSPLYAYFSAGVYALFGWQNFLALHLAQSALGAFSCALLMVIARTWLDRRSAWVAAITFAFAAPGLYYEHTLLHEVLVLAAYVVLLWGLRTGSLALYARRGGAAANFRFSGAALRFVLAGTAGAIAAVGRGNAMALLVAAALWCLLALREQPAAGHRGAPRGAMNWRAAGLFALGAAIVFAPLVWRNLEVSGRLTLGMTNGPLLFYMGNAADAPGYFDRSPRYLQANSLQASAPDIYTRQFLEDLAEHPGAIAFNLLRKTYFFLGATDFPDNHNFQLARQTLWPLQWLTVQWEWLAPLGLFGLLLTAFSKRRNARDYGLLWLFAAVFAASIIMIIPVGRYRLPMLIVWAIGAGFCFESGRRAVAARAYRSLLLSIAAVIAIAATLGAWTVVMHPRGYILSTDIENMLIAAAKARNADALERTITAASSHSPEERTVWASYRLDAAELRNDPAAFRKAVAELESTWKETASLHKDAAFRLARGYLLLGRIDRAESLIAALDRTFPDEPFLAQLHQDLMNARRP